MLVGTAFALNVVVLQVRGDGKGGAKLRKEAEYTSPEAGEAILGATVRVDKAKELPNGKFRKSDCRSVTCKYYPPIPQKSELMQT